MTRLVLLNNVEHRDVRVITRHSVKLGDGVMYTFTFPAEFRNIQAHYPIVFTRLGEDRIVPGEHDGIVRLDVAEFRGERERVHHAVAELHAVAGDDPNVTMFDIVEKHESRHGRCNPFLCM